ncbi:hypothetical protein V8E51_016518 [Hyaloscypha variabilis]
MRLLEYNDEGEFSLADSFGDETHSISYFHTRGKQFSRGSGDVCHAGKFFTSCAVQLARNVPQIQRFISDAVTEQKDIANQSLRDQWRQLTLGPLSRLDSSSSPSSYVLIVDALDDYCHAVFHQHRLANSRTAGPLDTPHPLARGNPTPHCHLLPWPALRARLLTPDDHLLLEAGLQYAYMRLFKLCWPFAFEDTFSYNASTSQYEIPPLFERYHNDLQYWGMERTFFGRFLELEDIMASYEGAVGRAFGDVDELGGGKGEDGPFVDFGGIGILEGFACA